MRAALSLNSRLLITATLVLATFLSLTGLALDTAFQDGVLAAVKDRLQTQIYMLLGAANLADTGNLELPAALPEPRLSSPGSGLYAEILADDADVVWSSPSSVGIHVPWVFPAEPGIPLFADASSSDGSQLFTMGFAVTWEISPGEERAYVFLVAESRVGFDAQVAGFRQSLGLWLAGATFVLLTVQGLILAWGLAPLRRLARQVREIEAGQRAELTGRYPKELMGLTENLNAMIRNSRVQLKRYRDSLGDLAHSLKTPLAVLHNSVEEGLSEELPATVREQVARMDQTVDYQLQRAAASGRTALATPVDVEAVARRLMSSLEKVYKNKSPNLQIQMARETIFYGDPGDLTEILGNLADNACKWCHRRVQIRGHKEDSDSDGNPRLILEVEDDGPGIPQPTRRAVMNRGVRGDVVVSGQGIGLAVVRELVEEVYGGSLEIDAGQLGGALIRLRL